jgi:hypothetical protein
MFYFYSYHYDVPYDVMIHKNRDKHIVECMRNYAIGNFPKSTEDFARVQKVFELLSINMQRTAFMFVEKENEESEETSCLVLINGIWNRYDTYQAACKSIRKDPDDTKYNLILHKVCPSGI